MEIIKLIFRKIKTFSKNPRLIRNYLTFLYDKRLKDFSDNINVLGKYVSLKSIEKTIIKINYGIQNFNDSWHYAIFKLFSLDRNPKMILEIGTYKGDFTNYLSKIFPSSTIFSIDLPANEDKFINSYSRKKILNDFILNRNKNLEPKNIQFIELDSYNLIDVFFGKNKFDLIWIDGDHLNPQVTIDILSSLKLITANGLIVIDDVIKEKDYMDDYVSNESFLLLEKLKSEKIIDFDLIVKRISKKNFYLKKYIALVKLLKTYKK